MIISQSIYFGMAGVMRCLEPECHPQLLIRFLQNVIKHINLQVFRINVTNWCTVSSVLCIKDIVFTKSYRLTLGIGSSSEWNVQHQILHRT